jgi:hypothetical protein
MAVRRLHYFEDPLFIECFSPHPDHQFMPPVSRSVDGIRPLIDQLETATRGQKLTIAKWLIEPGSVTEPGQPVAVIERVPPDNRTAHIMAPCFGKVSETAANGTIPDGPLFTLKTYSADTETADPFQELRAACDALNAPPPRTAAQPTVATRTAAPAPPRVIKAAPQRRRKWTVKQGLTFIALSLVIPGVAFLLMAQGKGDFIFTDVGTGIYIGSFIVGIILAWWVVVSRSKKV